MSSNPGPALDYLLRATMERLVGALHASTNRTPTEGEVRLLVDILKDHTAAVFSIIETCTIQGARDQLLKGEEI